MILNTFPFTKYLLYMTTSPLYPPNYGKGETEVVFALAAAVRCILMLLSVALYSVGLYFKVTMQKKVVDLFVVQENIP